MKNINVKSIMIAIGVLGFGFTVTALHIAQTDCNPNQQLMSELALGKHGSIMLLAFVSFSVAVFVAQKILGTYKNNWAVRIPLVIASFSLAGAEALQFTSSTDVNDILWEHFSAEQQAEEIEQTWPGTGYTPNTEY